MLYAVVRRRWRRSAKKPSGEDYVIALLTGERVIDYSLALDEPHQLTAVTASGKDGKSLLADILASQANELRD